jgi:ankyrin repeat protein
MFVLNAETVEILVSEGAFLDAQNSYGRTPLMIASMYGREEVVESLLKLGANPNLKDNYERTALSFAEENNYTSIEKLLNEAISKTIPDL